MHTAALLHLVDHIGRLPIHDSPPSWTVNLMSQHTSAPCTSGEDEPLITELAGCLGAWAAHATPEELAATLAAGPLAPAQPGAWPQRLGNALSLASAIQHALPRCDM